MKICSTNSLKNDSGFIFVLAPPLILLGFVAFSVLSFQRHNLSFREHSRALCRISHLDQQKVAGQTISAIMSLNPLASALKIQMIRLLVSLSAAVASKNAPAVARISAEIVKVKEKQKRLDLKQKMLMRSGLAQITFQQMKLRQSLLQLNSSSQIVTAKVVNINISDPQIAIEPAQKAELAPIYVYKKPFEQSQAMSTSWIESFSWKSKIKFSHRYNGGCEATLQLSSKEALKPKLKGDKFF